MKKAAEFSWIESGKRGILRLLQLQRFPLLCEFVFL